MPSIRTSFWTLAVILGGLVWGSPASADPDDMSVAAYEKSQRNAEQRARARAEVEFEDRIAEVEALSNPGVIGEEITVRLLRGGRPTATGRLYEVLPGREAYARIGDTKVNLADLSPVDRQRVLMAVKSKAAVAQELEVKRGELDGLIEKRVALLTRIHLEDDGYSPTFFSNTVRMGGHYYPYTSLGDGKPGFVLSAIPVATDPYQAYFKVRLQNPSEVPGLSVLLFDGKPIYATFPTDKDPELLDAKWGTVTFIMSRELADPEPEIMVPRLLELRTYRLNAGTWLARPEPLRSRLEGQDVAAFRFNLLRERVKPYEPSMRNDFIAQVEAARAYQVRMVKEMEASQVRKVEEAAAEAIAATKAAEEAAIAAAAAAAAVEAGGTAPEATPDGAPVQIVANDELTRKRVEIHKQYKPVLDIWYGPSNPPKRVLELPKTQIAGKWTGDINAPSAIEGQTVVHISPWKEITERAKDRDAGISFLGAKVRYLELAPNATTGAPQFVVQVAIFAHNTSTVLARLRPQVTATFKKDAKYDWLTPDDLTVVIEQNFQMMPSWHGNLVVTQAIPVELVVGGLDKVSLKILPIPDDPTAPAVETVNDETPTKVEVVQPD